MKKVFAVCMVVCLIVCAMAISVSAKTQSPIGDEKVAVMVRDGNDATGVKTTVTVGGTIKVEAKKNDFKSWDIYKVTVKGTKTSTKKAVEGVDYVIVSGKLNEIIVEVKPNVDLILCANYGSQKTVVPDFNTGKSPKTADNTPIALAVAALCFGGVALVAKKQLAK